MLTYHELTLIERALRDQTVLTVYVNGEERDPSKRLQWRTVLRHALDDIERWLSGSSHTERESFAARRAMVEERLGAFQDTIRAPGWVGFFTAEGVHLATTLPVATPTMAAWSTGPTLAPCVRVLKETRPVVVALADSRMASIYRYADRRVEPVETLEARAAIDAERHMGRPPGAGFHQGTRGPTERDERQRELHSATTHMLGDLTEKLVELAGPDGWILVGGIPGVALAALKRLRKEMEHRTAHVPSLTTSATPTEIGEAARVEASRLRNVEDERQVDAVLASSESDGRGVRGAVDAMRALENGSVHTLYFTPSFLANQAADTEAAVRIALSTRALVEQVSGSAAERLDQAGGIAASLRYASIPEAPSAAGWAALEEAIGE